MSTSIIERLFAAGDTLSGKFFRVIGVQDGGSTVQPIGYASTNLRLPTIGLFEATSLSLITGALAGNSSGFASTASTAVQFMNSGYTPPGVNGQRSFKSTSANDASAGTGWQQVKFTYFDQTLAGPFTETLTLNGLTAVNTVSTTIAFVEKFECARVGSGGLNAGTINMFTNTGGTGAIIMADGNAQLNQTSYCQHYVPAGKTGYVIKVRFDTSVAAGYTYLFSKNPLTATSPRMMQVVSHGQAGPTFELDFTRSPIVVPGPGFIFVGVQPDVATASFAEANFDWVQM